MRLHLAVLAAGFVVVDGCAPAGFALGVSHLAVPFVRATAIGFDIAAFDVNGIELFSIDAATAIAASGGLYHGGPNGGIDVVNALDGLDRLVIIQSNNQRAPIFRFTPGAPAPEEIVANPSAGDINVDSLSVLFSGP